MDYYEKALELHEKYRGKISVSCEMPLSNKEELSVAYTPGVAKPCIEIAENPSLAYKYTAKGHLVAVVSDGSAVLGLGNIGGVASQPVMEGKCALFKRFGGIDAFPICLATQETEEIIATVKAIAPTFGAINLEDISAPKCFEVEERLRAQLDIPVFHDDQHGTAAVVLAALINALKLVGKQKENIKVVLSGCGAAGIAIIKLLLTYGVKNIVAVDSKGIVCRDRAGLNPYKKAIAKQTNQNNIFGGLAEAIENADVFIGVSKGGLLKKEMVLKMAKNPIVFAMANPTPELSPEEAKETGVAVYGTGRSDLPNQINNVLVFPGLFKGALEAGAKEITDEMILAAAKAIAELVSIEELSADYIIPDAFNPRIASAVAKEVMRVAKMPETKVAAAIIEREGKFLVCKRKAGGDCAFLWEFAGGKLEKGETPGEALIRECKEELEVEINEPKTVMEYPFTYPSREIYFYFMMAKMSGEPVLKVHSEAKWLRPEEMNEEEFCPADREIIAKLKEDYRR